MVCSALLPPGKTFPRLGLGTWALGGGNDWGDSDPAAAQAAVLAALDEGVSLIDTAPAYGFGRAEELLGRALKGRRTEVLLCSKCGICFKNSRPDHDLRPESIYAECEASLKRLQTDYIDLYQVHWPDPKVPPEDTFGVLERLKEQGKIRAIGVCNFGEAGLERVSSLADVCAAQERWSLLSPVGADMQSVCRRKSVALMAYGALGGGILSGKYRRMPNFRRCDARRYFYKHYFGEDFLRAQALVCRVKETAARKGVFPSAVALAWVLSGGASCVLFGARDAEQVRQNVQAAQVCFSKEEEEFLAHGGH